MDIGYVSALSALAGSAVGGLTSAATTWIAQRAQSRAGQLTHDITQREDLYRDFITAASTTYGDALLSSEPRLAELVALYAMISRMRVLSAPRTVACADKIVLSILDTYFSPNRSVRELRDLIKAGAGIDPLREFSEAAREELWSRSAGRVVNATPNSSSRTHGFVCTGHARTARGPSCSADALLQRRGEGNSEP
jgi:hypothetical protein